MAYNTIKLEVRDGVGRLTLDRPNAANALDLQMCKELLSAALALEADASVRCILLTGAGKMFCGGGDLGAFATAGTGAGSMILEMTAHLHAALSRFARMDPPLVAAVNGAAGGAGLSLAVGCDLVVAAESAKLTAGYTAAGLTPDGSLTWTLPRLIGLRRAQELLLTNRRLSSREALEWGLVTRVVPDDDLMSEAEKLAVLLAQGPTAAYGRTRHLLLSSAAESFETQMEHEAQQISASARTHDGSEGIQAFLEKRAPRFEGR